ncbi:hypothetical protein JG687_00014446 [Phytophthora cactorum]|uniref:Uncharacterized protein n=1 Tax=Phytophthora cactorum TaxID=29920 RepID=A0A329RK79_9STRA|nr:hypothetical protein GQ600_17357 [Phytophthora cactorum]KAG2761921.1 hypothetical protein Pcac1_g26336 [Phytophthora cactorum]KAG2812017.1 hypothetical protein PC112_g15363 [Phytophthora cactorum]KAG2851898.1 hypothetical protein PC113_g15500 [Phytophthora cactorum]KAG2880203.1 hypothetical protein PC114_g22178 [Phytophthora cactorum]
MCDVWGGREVMDADPFFSSDSPEASIGVEISEQSSKENTAVQSVENSVGHDRNACEGRASGWRIYSENEKGKRPKPRKK